jgi:hypothetical protein
MKVRLTQKDLKFGVYWGKKDCLNSGLSLWMFGKYVWPLRRGHAKHQPKEPALPFKESETV